MANLFVVSGPSGCGKSTILKEILKDEKIKFSVSATTRSPRDGEKDGINYYFISKKEFEEKIKEDLFYEYSFHFGNYYGTLKEKVDKEIKAGYDIILDIDINGAMQIKENYPNPIMIFIKPPSLEELILRLRKRNTESEETLKERIERANLELSYQDKYDYVVTNDKLEKAIEEFKGIVLNG